MIKFSMIKFFLDPAASDSFTLSFERKTAGSSGFDLHANIGLKRQISPGHRILVRTGLYLAMEPGIEAQVRPRSGLCRDHGIVTAFGSIDSDYRGEIGVTLFNHGRDTYEILPGDRVAQLVFAPVFPSCGKWFGEDGMSVHPFRCIPQRVFALNDLGITDRGSSGFGSTGR